MKLPWLWKPLREFAHPQPYLLGLDLVDLAPPAGNTCEIDANNFFVF